MCHVECTHDRLLSFVRFEFLCEFRFYGLYIIFALLCVCVCVEYLTCFNSDKNGVKKEQCSAQCF